MKSQEVVCDGVRLVLVSSWKMMRKDGQYVERCDRDGSHDVCGDVVQGSRWSSQLSSIRLCVDNGSDNLAFVAVVGAGVVRGEARTTLVAKCLLLVGIHPLYRTTLPDFAVAS